MNKQRPININPLSIELPISALISISHRITGVLLFVALPGLIWILQQSLASQDSWVKLNQLLTNFSVKFGLWIIIVAFSLHIFAGVRHLIMDLHMADSLCASRKTAWFTVILTIIMAILSAYWLWR